MITIMSGISITWDIANNPQRKCLPQDCGIIVTYRELGTKFLLPEICSMVLIATVAILDIYNTEGKILVLSTPKLLLALGESLGVIVS